MNRPNKENIKVEYIKGVAEISSVTKQYSRQQDKYIDYLESKVLKLNKANVIKSVCKCGNELTEKEIFYETCLKCDRTV